MSESISHIDDDGIMTMMWAKNGHSCFIKQARKQQIMGLAGKKEGTAMPPHCRRKDSVKFVWIFCTLTTGGNYSDSNLF